MMPKLIAPDPDCDWCVAQMREPTLMGQALVSPGHAFSEAQALLAGRLHELRYHVHCDMLIGDRDYAARAQLALPLLATPTVVMYDVNARGAGHLGLTANRCASDRRMHWADDVSESMKFAARRLAGDPNPRGRPRADEPARSGAPAAAHRCR